MAPILAKHCIECHQIGGRAPLPRLSTFADARRNAAAIRRAVANRTMPPWIADNTGLCNTWQHARWLGAEEVKTVVTWVESGALEGRPFTVPFAVQAREEPPFRADGTISTSEAYAPGIGPGAYHCFVLDPRQHEDSTLNAIRLRATDARGLQQVTLYSLDDDEGEAMAKQREERPGGGFYCFGTPELKSLRLLASAAAADSVIRFQPDSGPKVRAGTKLLMQTRFNLRQVGRSYATDVAIDLELGRASRGAEFEAVRADGALEAGKRYVVARTPHRVTSPSEILGFVPRMHYRGRKMSIVVERGNRAPECFAAVEEWSFSSERYVGLESPVRVEPGDTLTVKCAFETLGTASKTTFGENPEQEECLASFLSRAAVDPAPLPDARSR